jgi:hypothetical protein
MNEEALNYSYELFKKDGYNGTVEDYSKLLSENEDALNHSYSLFQKDGYNDSEDDYRNLLSLKKKAESTSTNTELVSEPKVETTNSDLPKQTENTNEEGVISETELFGEKQKPETKSKVDRNYESIYGETNVDDVIGRFENEEPSDLVERYNATESTSENEKNELRANIDDDSKNKGLWNTIKQGAKNYWNNLIPENALKVSTDNLNESKEKAKKFFKKEGLKPTDNDLKNKATSLEYNKREASLIKSKKRGFMKTLSDADRSALLASDGLKESAYSKRTADDVIEQKILRKDAENNVLKTKEIEFEIIEFQKKNEEVPEFLKKEYTDSFELSKQKILKAKEQYLEYAEDAKELGNIQSNIDLFKRDFGWFTNFAGNIASAEGNILSGLAASAAYVNDLRRTTSGTTGGLPKAFSEYFLDKSKNIKKTTEGIQDKIMRPLSVDDINTPGDFGSWLSNTAVAQQIPILTLIGSGYGGMTALGLSSTGQKYSEMTEEDKKKLPEEEKYSASQKFGVPIAFGVADFVGTVVDASILKGTGRIFKSATTAERKIIAKNMFQKATDLSGEFLNQTGKALLKEVPEEMGVQVFQNGLDIFALNKKGINLGDGVKDAAAASIPFALLPGGAVVAKSVFKPFSRDSKLDNALRDVELLESKLNNPETVLSEKARTLITKKLKDKKTKLAEISIVLSEEMKSMSENSYNKVLKIEEEKKNIREDALEVKKDNSIDESSKELLLKEFQEDFNQLENKQKLVLNTSNSNKFNALSPQEKIKVKEEAQKVLVKEKQDAGETEFKISDSEITEKANELSNKKPNPTLEETKEGAKNKTVDNTISMDEVSRRILKDRDNNPEIDKLNKKLSGIRNGVERSEILEQIDALALEQKIKTKAEIKSEGKKVDIEKRRQVELDKALEVEGKGLVKSSEVTDKGVEKLDKKGDIYNQGLKVNATFMIAPEGYKDGKVEVIVKQRKPQINKDGVMTQPADVTVMGFSSLKEGERYISENTVKVNPKRIPRINAEFDAELDALENETQTKGDTPVNENIQSGPTINNNQGQEIDTKTEAVSALEVSENEQDKSEINKASTRLAEKEPSSPQEGKKVLNSPFEKGKYNADENLEDGLFVINKNGELTANENRSDKSLVIGLNSPELYFEDTWDYENTPGNSSKGFEVITPAKFKLVNNADGTSDYILIKKGIIRFRDTKTPSESKAKKVDTKTEAVPALESNKNETQEKGDTSVDGDVQPGNTVDNNKGQDEKIQPANDSKTSESAITETLSLDDLINDLEGIELEDDVSKEKPEIKTEKKPSNDSKTIEKKTKVVTDKSEIQKLKNSIAEGEMLLKSKRKNSGKKYTKNELIAIEKSVDNAKAKLGINNSKTLKNLRGKTPLDKRDTKDKEMLKAMKAEVYDAYSLVQQFFISGGRVLSTDISKLYRGSTKEIKSRIGYARKDGKTIDDIANDLWEEFGTELNIDTQEFSNAVESVLQDFLSTKAMAVDLNTRNGEKLIETPEGLMTEEQFKDYENYLKETEESVANYLLTLTEEELLNKEQEGKDYEEYEKRRINQKNSENGKKKPGVQTSTNRENGKSPEERQLEQKITEAQNSVSKAKTALENKSKKLDASILEDQDDLFGERKSKTEDSLFDERVDLSQRENATSQERQALKDAQEELKRLKDAKKNLKETTSEIDFDNTQTQPRKKPTAPKKLSNDKVEKIDDFGDKIGGARKDLVSVLDGVSEDDMANLPLSKSFPEPNYKKLIEDGIISEKAAILLKFFYNAIPNKPRVKYKVKSWVLKIKENIKIFTDVISSETLSDKLVDNVSNSASLGNKFNIFSKTMTGLGFPETNPKTGGYTIKQFINKQGNRFTIVKGNNIIKDFKTLEDAVAGLKLLLDSNTNKKATVKLNVYQDRKTKDYFIGKQTATGTFRIMEGFKSGNEAFIHLQDNKIEIENIWANLKLNPEERRNENRTRVGTDWRNGKNITPEIFTNAFGFRGVEFGNWVENTRRQEALNETYDAFMDMANALGLSPRSISLNGTLGMAFGARGKGKAMAHYEPGKVVINLTKKKGAGSLGHEWFHALDNYFSRKFDRNGEFITDRPKTRIGKDGKLDERIRTEVLKAFKDLIDTINASGLKERSSILDSTKSKAYWNTTIEMAARSFENFLITKLDSQNEQNDFLANFKETGDWLSQTGLNLDNYPYPLDSESDAINSSFKNLFDTLDIVPEKGKKVSKLDELENLLNTWDNNIDQFGRENLSMGLPLVVAKVAIKAMKVSVKVAKTTAEVLQAGLDAIKNTDWYKSLTKDEQSKINDITVYQLIQNAKKSNAEQEVKPKVEKKVKEKTTQNTQPKTESNTEETSEKPQAFSTRSFNSEGLNQGVKDKLEKLGLDYAVKNQAVAEDDGNKIIKEFGLLEAYKMAKNNQIRGGAKIFIQSKMFDELNQQIYNAQQKEDTELSNELIDELSQIMKEFADEKTLMGQEISMLNRIYNTSDIKYDLEFAKIQWNKKFDQKMSSQIEARLKLQAQKIKKRDQKIKELEGKIGNLEEQDAMGNIQTSVNSKKSKPQINKEKKYSQKELDEALIESKNEWESENLGFKIPSIKSERKKSEILKQIQEVKNKWNSSFKDNTLNAAIPYAKQLIKATPEIVKLAKLYAEMGGLKTYEIIKEVEDVFKNIKESDIKSVLKKTFSKGGKIMTESTKRKIYISLLNKKIKSLDEQIEKQERERLTKEDKYADDTKIQELREIKKSKEEELEIIDPIINVSNKLEKDLNKAQKSIDDYKRKLADSDFENKSKNQDRIIDVNLRNLINKRDSIKNTFEKARSKYKKGLLTDSEIISKKLDQKEKSLEKRINSLKNNIPKNKRNKNVWNPKVSELENEIIKIKKDKKKLSSSNINDQDNNESKIKIPSSLIYSLVESGVNNITDLTNEVHEVLKEEYSNLTQREVRDAITDYGKRVNETQDDIKLKISSLKIDGKQISALEDLAENKRPKRSGKKQAKKTAEQRNNLKKIQELLKTLKFDDVGDKENFYKTALEGYKTRVENRIKDLNEAINKGERIINERRNLPLDQEAKNLIEKRDKLQKEYDKTFQKPYKSDETLINEIVTRKEKQLSDLKTKLEYIKLNKSEQVKPTKREVSDPKINELDELIESAREELSEVLDEVGVAEEKRLARAKKYVERSINELERRIKEKDFAPRKIKKVKYDKELIELKRQQILDKTKYDIEFEKQEYKEMSLAEKSLDKTFKLFGTFKGLKATFDLSAMLRQGAFLGAGNPKEFAKATVDMHKFVVSNKSYKTWMATVESSNDFVYMMEDGLSITDTSGDVLRSEERFVGNLISNIPGIGKVTDASERAYGGFLNSLRISSYRKLVKQHEILGYTRGDNPKVFKRIAYYVNGATGRGDLGSDKNMAKIANIVFFSPRMMTGMFSVTKTLVNPNTTKALRKESFKSLAAFAGYQYLSKLVIQQAYQILVMPFTGEDEDIISTDYRGVSTDFNKLRIGETRYDVSAGYGIAIRTLTRLLAQKKADSKEYEAVKFDGFTQGVGNESMKFLWNKTSPLARQIVNFHTEEHPNDIYKTIDDATVYDYFEALFIPLTLQELFKSIEDEVPVSKISFDTLLTVYGVGVQTYN